MDPESLQRSKRLVTNAQKDKGSVESILNVFVAPCVNIDPTLGQSQIKPGQRLCVLCSVSFIFIGQDFFIGPNNSRVMVSPTNVSPSNN